MHDFDDFSDWVEIYNPDSIDHDLSNYFLLPKEVSLPSPDLAL